MTFPIDIILGSVRVPSHLVFEILAYVLGFRLFLYLRNRCGDPISENNRVWIMVGGIFGALIFSRLFGVLENYSEWRKLNYSFLFLYGSKTILGGLFGGLIGVEAVKFFLKEKNSSGDLFTYPLILGMFVGRIGCFLTGVRDGTVGVESSLPWALDLGDGIKRHPVTLYEMVFLLILYTVLSIMEKRKAFHPGSKFKLLLLSYAFFRFLVEYIRPPSELFLNLTAIQILSLLVCTYYALSLIIAVKRRFN